MTSPGDAKGFNLKNHQELKKFAKLTQKIHHIFSREIKGQPSMHCNYTFSDETD